MKKIKRDTEVAMLTADIISDLRNDITTHTWFRTPQLLDCLDRWDTAKTTNERRVAIGQFFFLVDEETSFLQKALQRMRKHWSSEQN